MVHSPNAARAFQGLGGFIRHKSRLDPRLREIAILAVGWITQAPYEWSHHVKIGQEFGVSEDDIRAAHRRVRRQGERARARRPS